MTVSVWNALLSMDLWALPSYWSTRCTLTQSGFFEHKSPRSTPYTCFPYPFLPPLHSNSSVDWHPRHGDVVLHHCGWVDILSSPRLFSDRQLPKVPPWPFLLGTDGAKMAQAIFQKSTVVRQKYDTLTSRASNGPYRVFKSMRTHLR